MQGSTILKGNMDSTSAYRPATHQVLIASKECEARTGMARGQRCKQAALSDTDQEGS